MLSALGLHFQKSLSSILCDIFMGFSYFQKQIFLYMGIEDLFFTTSILFSYHAIGSIVPVEHKSYHSQYRSNSQYIANY